jgi:hypothetical protein
MPVDVHVWKTLDTLYEWQNLAGLGWGRSDIDVGVEDFGFYHPFQCLICEAPARGV